MPKLIPEIGLEFFTEDETDRELCKTYWLIEEDAFRYTIAEVGLRFRLKPAQVQRRVRAFCRAFIKKSRCQLCGLPAYYFERRGDFYDNLKIFSYQAWENPQPFLCKTCEQEAEKRREARKIGQKKTNTIESPLAQVSIFRSPLHLNYFKELRREKYFVYPSLDLGVFLTQQSESAKQEMATLLEGDIESLQSLRIDFLVCDAQGLPLEALDYDPQKKLSQEEIRRKTQFFAILKLPYQCLFA
ncbi:hypothetical protein [Hugenholtzia roseola]|uniref:hypothetical protein n=1 Tax=Hugenholtzia roseola TaxID=1002 RepID=UPI00041D5B05|nr:hypothetical protein [Hugenholtzia roseola]